MSFFFQSFIASVLCGLVQFTLVMAQPVAGNFIDVFIRNSALNGLGDMHRGPDGHLYVSSTYSDEILRFNGVTGAFIDVFITAQQGGMLNPSTFEFGPDGYLYVSSSYKFLRFDAATGALVDDFITDQLEPLDGVFDFFFHTDSLMYLISGTGEIIRYNPVTAAVVDTFITNDTSELEEPVRMTFGPDGHAYVIDLVGLGRVLKFDGTTGAFIEVFIPERSGELALPSCLAFAPDGSLYVCSSDNGRILRFDAQDGSFIETLIDGLLTNHPFWPTEIVFHGEHELLISNGAESDIDLYNRETGALVEVFNKDDSGGMVSPDGSAFGLDDNLYVSTSSKILRYDAQTGQFMDVFVSSGSGGLQSADDLVFGADGYLYVISQGTDQVLRYDGKTGAFIDVFVDKGSGGLDSPGALVFDGDGRLYVLNKDTAEVLRFDAVTGAFIDVLASEGNRLFRLLDIEWSPENVLYLMHYHGITRYDTQTGAFIDDLYTIDHDPQAPFQPEALTLGPDGNLYVATLHLQFLGGVMAIDLSTHTPVARDIVAPGTGGLTYPQDIAFSKEGLIHVTSTLNNAVMRFAGPPAVTLSEEGAQESTKTFALIDFYPNPFSTTATLSYRLEHPADVGITLYDMQGKQVRTLVAGHQPLGAHETVIDAGPLPAGVYLVLLEAEGRQVTRQVVVVR